MMLAKATMVPQNVPVVACRCPHLRTNPRLALRIKIEFLNKLERITEITANVDVLSLTRVTVLVRTV